MILAITDYDVACGCYCNSLETFEFAVAAAPTAEGLEEGTVGTEDLYAVVTGISDDDVALIVYGDTPRELELAFVRALRAEER